MKTLRKHSASKGGFTLIEILVVMAIIGILLATAVPAIIGQIAKQRENASAAKAHNLAIAAFSYSNDNSQTYPAAATSTLVFQTLYNGKYLQQPGDVFLTTAGGKALYTGSEQTINLGAANNSWDFVAETNAAGLTGTDPTDIPLLFSDCTGAPAWGAGINNATINATNPWGTDGVTLCTLGQQASFVRPGATPGSVPLTTASFAPPSGGVYVTLKP